MQDLINYIRTIMKDKQIELQEDLSLMFGGETLYLIDKDLNRVGTIYIDSNHAVYLHNDQDLTNFVMVEEYAVKASKIHDELAFSMWKQLYLLPGESSPEHLITIDQDTVDKATSSATGLIN